MTPLKHHVAAALADAAGPEELLGQWRAVADRLVAAPPVSVVVPIFNGFEALRGCLDAVIAHSAGVELILVDDCSTDPRIRSLCDAVLARIPEAKLVVNSQNRGFVTSVNAGLRAAAPANDVILLNSDTMVPERWLRKLRTAAYSSENVATASPLSNAAGVYSIPTAYEDRPLPNGWNTGMANRLLEDLSERRYEPTPATSGFCLYIRRAALDAVGSFDDRLIRRGYGEENDFCERATRLGMVHVVDDGTFVFHEREASFGPAKSRLKQNNSRVLKSLHPVHIETLQAWLSVTTLSVARERYGAALEEFVGDHHEADAQQALGRVFTHMLVTGVGQDLDVGSWHGDDRQIVVTLSGKRADIDVFGLRHLELEVDEGSRAALTGWMINRWSVDALTTRPGLLPFKESQALTSAWSLADRPSNPPMVL